MMSPNRPAVTVVMPSHNHLLALPGALDSVYRQGINGLELIVVDDNSDDGTHDYLIQQQGFHPTLRIIRSRGIGACSGRNMAISAAKGDLIAFLEPTDQWLDGKLSSQLAFHQSHPDIQFSFARFRCLDQEPAGRDCSINFWQYACRTVAPGSGYQRLSADMAAMLFANNPIAISTVMARRSALLTVGGFDKQLSAGCEWDLWLKLTLHGQIAASNSIDSHCVAGSSLADRQRHICALRQIISRYRNRFTDHHHSIVRCAEAHLSHAYASLYRQQRQWFKALLWDTRARLQYPAQRLRRQYSL